MKTLILLITATLLLSHTAVQAQKHDFECLIGKWEGVDENKDRGKLVVLDSTNIFLVYGNQQKPIVSYNADFSQSPVWFDFTIKDSTENVAMKSLFQFINEDLVQWQVFYQGKRPDHFTRDRGSILYLRRSKQVKKE